MKPLHPPEANRVLGIPESWPSECSCHELPVVDLDAGPVPTMATTWQPTPDELLALIEGAPVLLFVAGSVHPPVHIEAGFPPELPDHERHNAVVQRLVEAVALSTLKRGSNPAAVLTLLASVIAGSAMALETVCGVEIKLKLVLEEAERRMAEIRTKLGRDETLRQAEPAGRA